jgi:hypothetical protein
MPESSYYLLGPVVGEVDFPAAPSNPNPPALAEARVSLGTPPDAFTFPLTVPAFDPAAQKPPIRLHVVYATLPTPDGASADFFMDPANGFPTISADSPIADPSQPSEFTLHYDGPEIYDPRYVQVIEEFAN